jgi:hypothetical protein
MSQRSSTTRSGAVRRAAALLALLAALGGAAAAEADGLRDTVKNLWPDGIRLQPTAPPFPSHEPHFLVSSLQGLDTLNTALASSLGIFALNSTVSGFTFDVERGIPVRTTESLGPLLAERAETIGARKLNVAFTYTRIDFSKFEGRSLDDLSIDFSHDDVNGNGQIDTTGTFAFESDIVRADLDLDIAEDVFALFATYGLTRTWDVGVVVPIVHVRLRAEADATIVRNSAISTRVHNFGPQSSPAHASGGGDETGVGDILLRTKYHFLEKPPGWWPDLAVVGQVKLPTGDEDDLLGTGETNFLALLVASRTVGRFTPHLNLGYEVTTGGSDQDNLRYIVGVDARVHPRLTAAVDVLGRWEPDGDDIGDHIVDVALGLKWNPVGSFIVSGNVMLPLNKDEGLRADVIWTIGVEYTF